MLYILILILLISVPLFLLWYNYYSFNKEQKPFVEDYLSKSNNKLPSFEEKSLDGNVFTEDDYSMPFMDIKIFNPYNDERIALFVTGGSGQKNKVYLYKDGEFKDIAKELGLEGLDEAAYSMVALDIDNDGIKEVVIGYGTAVYMQKFNNESKQYEKASKIADVPDAAIAHDITYADTRNSGFQDLFVSTFVDKKHFTSAVYHDKTNKRANLFLINNGDGTFTNKAEEAGLGIVENTYLSQFVDINNNGKQDLVLAMNTNTGYIYENIGNGTFKPHKLPIDNGFWMGLSVEKITDKTDKYHILMSNVGKSFPSFLLRGDLKKEEKFDAEYALLEQVNGFTFKNVTKEKNLYSNVFGWGLQFVDLNNNGRKDAVLTENYIKFPVGFHKKYPSKGKVFMQDINGKFAMLQDELKLLNPHFGYRVINYDLTGNGFQDVIIGNVDGPVKIFYNNGI